MDLPARVLLVLLGALALQRLLEMRRSRRNIALLEPGARPADSTTNWNLMVSLHALWIAGLGVELVGRGHAAPRALFAGGLGAFAIAQVLRWSALRALREAWNARGLVDPNLSVVDTGPYRFIRHPNYVAVVIELLSLPLAAGAWWTLGLTLPPHLWVLARRIRGEERRLFEVPGYRETMGPKGRFWPRRGVRRS